MSTLMTAPHNSEFRTIESVSLELSDVTPLERLDSPYSSQSLMVHLSNRLATLLQRSLDLKELLQLFSAEIYPLVDHSGMEFNSASDSLNQLIGKRNTHRCSYRLITNGKILGELRLFCSHAFTDEKLETLETATLSLLYPLQNALMYKRAVVASLTDPLTGAGNRKGLLWHLKRELDLARRFGTQMAVLMIDIDNFKIVNDKYGHAAGDLVLKAVVDEIFIQNRRIDLCFRYGGEEFVVLLSTTDLNGAEIIGKRTQHSIAGRPIKLTEEQISITVSIGAAALRGDDSEQTLLERADQALYRAKNSGKNRVVANR